jgi:hypothetical protein
MRLKGLVLDGEVGLFHVGYGNLRASRKLLSGLPAKEFTWAWRVNPSSAVFPPRFMQLRKQVQVPRRKGASAGLHGRRLPAEPERSRALVVTRRGPRSDLGFEGCCFKFCGLRAYCMFRSNRGEEAWPYPQTQGADRLRSCLLE